MEKTLKNNAPDGYEIDKVNTTFDKIDDVVIKWNATTYAVEINADGEHFMVDASRPSYCCSWDDAMRFHRNGIWYLPTIKQVQVLSNYLDDINENIRENGGYEIIERWYWSCEEKNKDLARYVFMSDGYVNHSSKRDYGYVRAVCVL